MGAFQEPARRVTSRHGVAPAIAKTGSSGGLDHQNLEGLRSELERTLSQELARKTVAIHIGPDGLVLSLREFGFFNSGSAQIRPETEETLSRIMAVLCARPHRLRIEGHTDNVPIHNGKFFSNWELSTARATEIVRRLAVTNGFSPENLSAAGYAEFHPVSDNFTEEGRQINRRVDIVVLASSAAHGSVQ